jgi:hypothetical protein
MIFKKFILHLIILIAPIGCALAIELHPSKTTVCEISKAKPDFVGKTVQVRGLYETDMRHGAYLRDSNCPGKGIRIGYFINENDQSIVKFEYDQGVRYTKLNEVRKMQVSLIGKLVRDGDEESLSDIRSKRRKFRFDVIKIINYKFLPN